MSWRLDRDGAALWEPLSLSDLQCRDEEIRWMDVRNKPWRLINGLLEQSAKLNARPWKGVDTGLMTALAGGFAGVESPGPQPATLATATILTTEVALWNTATYTPIAANPQCPKAYRLVAFGTSTTPASQGTMAFNARFGQIITSPLIGASTATAQTASQTATPWKINGDMLIQRGGPATSGLVAAIFRYHQGTAVSGGSLEIAALSQLFGTTTGAQSVVTDGSVAAGLWMGGIATTSTTSTYIPQAVIFASWN